MNEVFPIRYVEPVFRPPSEADSLIFPVTNGCSWNRCTYCEMYTAPQKKFGPRDEQETLDAIRRCGEQFAGQVQRVFIGDGDAMVLSTRRLMTLLTAIKTHLPKVRRISSYCLPRNLRHKTVQELQDLRAADLSLVYVGAESGDDAVLQHVYKGETFETTRDALDKLGAAGIPRSVMLLNGLGGRQFSQQHGVSQRPRLQLAGAQGDFGRRKRAFIAGGGQCDASPRVCQTAPKLAARAVDHQAISCSLLPTMLSPFKNLLNQFFMPANDQASVDDARTLQLATAVLLVEVMRSDTAVSATERTSALSALRTHFALSDAELARLLARAEDTAKGANDYFRFTSAMNDQFTQAEKIQVVEHMWQVAFADGHLDANENHLISKIAGLLHVTHGEYIAAKLHARQAAQPAA
jgi:uncharacterized tellurite resistance protein B-like protein